MFNKFSDEEYSNKIILQSKYNKDNFSEIEVDMSKVSANISPKDALVLREPFLRFVRFHPNYVNLLCKNLENVKIKRLVSPTKEGDFDINLFKEKCRYRYSSDVSRYHELLHMASSYREPDLEVVRVGFSYRDNVDSFNIGYGLAEGYTSLLEERDTNNDKSIYIKKDGTLTYNSYWLTNALTRELEVIIGKDKMEELYFCGDLEGIIDILSNYITRDEIFSLLEAFDLSITKYCNKEDGITDILNAQLLMRNIVLLYMPDRLEEFDLNNISIKNGEYILAKEEAEKEKLNLKEKENSLVRLKNTCLSKVSTPV